MMRRRHLLKAGSHAQILAVHLDQASGPHVMTHGRLLGGNTSGLIAKINGWKGKKRWEGTGQSSHLPDAVDVLVVSGPKSIEDEDGSVECPQDSCPVSAAQPPSSFPCQANVCGCCYTDGPQLFPCRQQGHSVPGIQRSPCNACSFPLPSCLHPAKIAPCYPATQASCSTKTTQCTARVCHNSGRSFCSRYKVWCPCGIGASGARGCGLSANQRYSGH